MIYLNSITNTFLDNSVITFNRTKDFIDISYDFSYTDDNGEHLVIPLTSIKLTTEDILNSHDKSDNSYYVLYMSKSSVSMLNFITNDALKAYLTNSENRPTVEEVKTGLVDFCNKNNMHLLTEHRCKQLFNIFPLNGTALTYVNKLPIDDIFHLNDHVKLAVLYIPLLDKLDLSKIFINLNVSDSSILNLSEMTTVYINNLSSLNSLDAYNDEWIIQNVIKPTLKLTTSDNKKNIEITDTSKPIELKVSLLNDFNNELILDRNCEIYIDHVNGYSPKSRVLIDPTTGTNKFKVYPTYLESGDFMRVKVGFKYFTGVDEVIITVK